MAVGKKKRKRLSSLQEDPTRQTHHPWADTPLGRHSPGQTPQADTLRQTYPGKTPTPDRHHPRQTPPRQTPPWADTPPQGDIPRQTHTPLGRHLPGQTSPSPG